MWAGGPKWAPSLGQRASGQSCWEAPRRPPESTGSGSQEALTSPGWVEWLSGWRTRKWLMWTLEISLWALKNKGGNVLNLAESFRENVENGTGGVGEGLLLTRGHSTWDWITKESFGYSGKGGIIWWQWNKWFILLTYNTTIPCLLSIGPTGKEDIRD